MNAFARRRPFYRTEPVVVENFYADFDDPNLSGCEQTRQHPFNPQRPPAVVPPGPIVRRFIERARPIVETPFLLKISALAVPTIIVPFNDKRQALKIANPNTGAGTSINGVMISFGAPLQIGANKFAGIPIGPLAVFQDGVSDAVSIDDIYCWCNDAAATFPFFIVAYEGRPWLERI